MKTSTKIIIAAATVVILGMVIFNCFVLGAYKAGKINVVDVYKYNWKSRLQRVEMPTHRHLVINGAILERPSQNGPVTKSIGIDQDWQPSCLVSSAKSNAISILKGMEKYLVFKKKGDTLFITIEKQKIADRLPRSYIWDASIFVETTGLQSIAAQNVHLRLDTLSSRGALNIKIGDRDKLSVERVRAPLLEIKTGADTFVEFQSYAVVKKADTALRSLPVVRYSLGKHSEILLNSTLGITSIQPLSDPSAYTTFDKTQRSIVRR